MKKKRLALILLALGLALTTAIPGALAYFTTTTDAQGGRVLRFGSNTDITEEFGDWTKHVVISSQPVTQPAYVRARAFSVYPLTYSGEGWTQSGDGWCYYALPIANLGEGETQPAGTVPATAALDIKITVPDLEEGTVPEGFEVTVVYETSPVRYTASGEPYPSWQTTVLPGTEGESA